MQNQTIGLPSPSTQGLYRFMTPKEAVKTIVDATRYRSIYEQWNYELLCTARGVYSKMLPSDREMFVSAFRQEFGDDADALADPSKMARIGAYASKAVQEVKDYLYEGIIPDYADEN